MNKQGSDLSDSDRNSRTAGTEDSLRTLPASEPENTFLAETSVAVTMSGADFERDQVLCRRYRIVRELGRGGMGAVYLCHDEIAGIEVALKAVPPELCRNRDQISEIIGNFRIVGKLFHPNIAALKNIELDETTGKYCVVMELVEGSNLHTFRKSRGGRLAMEEVLAISRQLASALDYAHSQKVIHRDIKPSNIMIRPDDGQVKVLDFGIAAEFQTSLSLVTQADYGTSGTAVYMAPEQWLGRFQDGRTDQYALACVAYEMLVGRPPFECPTFDMMRKAVLNSDVERPEEMDAAVWGVIVKALAKDRHDRFETCTAFTEALADPSAKNRVAGRKKKGGMSARRTRVVAAATAFLALAAGSFLFYMRPGTPLPGREPANGIQAEMPVAGTPTQQEAGPVPEPVTPADIAGVVGAPPPGMLPDQGRPPSEPAIEPDRKLPVVMVPSQPPRDGETDKPDPGSGFEPPPGDQAGVPTPAGNEPSGPVEIAMIPPIEPVAPLVPVVPPVLRANTRPRVAIIPGTDSDALRAELDTSFRAVFMEDGTLPPADPGIESHLITALANEEGLELMEREKLAQIVTEMKLGQSDLTDPAQAARVGRSIEADYLVIPEIRYIHIRKETKEVPFIPEPRISHVGAMGLDIRLVEVASSRVLWAQAGEETYRERAGRTTSSASGAVFIDRMYRRFSDNISSNILREIYIHVETEKGP